VQRCGVHPSALPRGWTGGVDTGHPDDLVRERGRQIVGHEPAIAAEGVEHPGSEVEERYVVVPRHDQPGPGESVNERPGQSELRLPRPLGEITGNRHQVGFQRPHRIVQRADDRGIGPSEVQVRQMHDHP
jgi:hypothetical protein